MEFVDKYSFIGEWYDRDSNFTKKFLVHYFPSDSSVELYDIKNRKTFLRRSIVENLSMDDFYIDSSIRVFARLIKLTDYGSEDSKKKLSKSVERTFAMIKPVSNDRIGDIIQCVQDRNYKIKQIKMSLLTKDTAIQACQSLRDDQNLESILDDLTCGPVVGMELVSENAVKRWHNDMNDINLNLCEKFDQNVSIPKKYFYGSANIDDALRDLSYFFPTGKLKSLGPTMIPTLVNCTCCVIKPHAIRDGNLGKIIKAITAERYVITTMKMFYMDNASAAEFYEVYKGVVPDYMGMIAEIISGPCVAMEIVGPADVNTPVEFRKLVGPIDPEIARQIRPHTIRARFGSTRTQNAVHCSDLPEDGVLEVEYFFKILD